MQSPSTSSTQSPEDSTLQPKAHLPTSSIYARPLSKASTATLEDAGSLLKRMDDKMHLLKAVIVKQQQVINDLKEENERLNITNDELVKTQHTSSNEITRLCEEVAENAARADVLLQQQQQKQQSVPLVIAPNGDENAEPKHIVVDRRAGVTNVSRTAEKDISHSPILAPRVAKFDNVQENTTSGSCTQAKPSQIRFDHFCGPRYTGNRFCSDPQAAATSPESNSDSRSSQPKPKIPTSVTGSEANATKSVGSTAVHQFDTSTRCAPPLGQALAIGSDQRIVQVARPRGRPAKGVPTAAITNLYANSRTAAKVAWNMLRTKPPYHGRR